ncbi:MAG: hypothetical protein MUP57_01720, partial [Clostridia bacterium]|nr:hypothetical protein [Clostridia bacterium]
MQQAIDIIIKNPVSVKSTASATATVEALIRSETGLVCVVENGIIKKLITPYSVIQAINKGKTLDQLKSVNLALEPCPLITPDACWLSSIPDL